MLSDDDDDDDDNRCGVCLEGGCCFVAIAPRAHGICALELLKLHASCSS
jgi:hypothetical protein